MKRLGPIAIAIVATLAPLAVAEIGLRLLASGLLDRSDVDAGNPFSFYRYDPKLGWSSIPGTRGTLTRTEFVHEVRFNSHGMRSPETTREKPPGVRRIAVLGDSFTWGVGASDEELFTTLVEKALPGTQVLNFGVSGYSPVQYHLLTEKVLSFDPDAVVIVFCLGNDFIDNVQWRRYRYYKPFARLDQKSQIVLDGYPIPYAGRHLRDDREANFYEQSYVYRLLDKTVLNHVRLLSGPGQKGLRLAESGSDFYRSVAVPEVDVAVRINAGLLKLITAAYAARRVPVVVVAAPTKCEFGKCFPEMPEPTDRALQHLKTSLEGLDVKLIDPTPDFTLDDFWTHDAHWRPSGHRKIANAMASHLPETIKMQTGGTDSKR